MPAWLDRALRFIVVTPDMHRVHHSILRHETDSNFGFNLPWWDRLFGTYRAQPEAGHVGMTIGLPAFRDPRELRIDRLLTQPFRSDRGTVPVEAPALTRRTRSAFAGPTHGVEAMSRMKSEDAIAAPGRPFTGAEYLASLRDGREVYIYGERVDDVTTHPAFRNAARSVARLYDALHDPKTKDVLTCPTDTGSGGFTHKFFRVARSREEVIGQRDAIAAWARMSYGWMGRSPDYKASLMNTLGANHDFYGKFADNAKRWYRRAQENVLFMNHAIVNPPVDRDQAADQVKDVFITIQKETDAGIYVSGAKVVATSSALTHYNFLGQNAAMPINDSDLAVMFIAPMNAPGVKLFCRASYEMMASVMGTPFDYPLSSRFDENDAIFVFDNVFIPWEDVLLHRDLDKLKIFYPQSGLRRRLPVPGLHAARGEARFPGRASSPRRCAPPAPTSSAATRRCSARSSPGATCSGRSPTRWR